MVWIDDGPLLIGGLMIRYRKHRNTGFSLQIFRILLRFNRQKAYKSFEIAWCSKSFKII